MWWAEAAQTHWMGTKISVGGVGNLCSVNTEAPWCWDTVCRCELVIPHRGAVESVTGCCKVMLLKVGVALVAKEVPRLLREPPGQRSLLTLGLFCLEFTDLEEMLREGYPTPSQDFPEQQPIF